MNERERGTLEVRGGTPKMQTHIWADAKHWTYGNKNVCIERLQPVAASLLLSIFPDPRDHSERTNMAWMSNGCDAGREDVLFQSQNTLFCLLTIVEPTGSGGSFYAPLATGGRTRGPPSEPVGPQDQQAYRRCRFSFLLTRFSLS